MERWLYNIWKYFWKTFWTIVAIVVVLLLCVMGALQLDVSQNYLTNQIEKKVQKKYKAHLSIGEISGFLPFKVQLHDVLLTGSDSSHADTLAKISSIQSRLKLWGLLNHKISISSLSIDEPQIRLKKNREGRFTFLQKKVQAKHPKADSSGGSWITGVEVLAPAIQIKGGQLLMPSPDSKKLKLPSELDFSEINADVYFEWSNNKRYFDIESFSSQIQDVSIDHISLSGQVYSEHDSLEFNSFHLNLGKSQFLINGKIDGLQPLGSNVREQFLTARYNLSVKSNGIYPRQIHQTVPGVPDTKGPFTLQLQTDGSTDALQVNRAVIGTGHSKVSLKGLFKHLRSRKKFAYHFKLDTVQLKQRDIRRMFDSLGTPQYQALEDLSVSGKVRGSIDSVNVDLGLASPLGNFDIQGQSQLKHPYRYSVSMDGQKVNIGFLSAEKIDSTSLNFQVNASGYGLSLKHSFSKLKAHFHHSKINDVAFDTLRLTSLLDHGVWKPEYTYKNSKASVSGSARINFNYKDPKISIKGKASNVNLSSFSSDSLLAATQLNFDYNVDMQSLNPDRMQGRASLDVAPSIIGKDTVQAHQFYMDLNSPGEQRRVFRLTSTLFDLTIRGQIAPVDLVHQTSFWVGYLKNRIRSEVLLKDAPSPQALSRPAAQKTINLNGIFEAKNLSLLKKYIPSFPAIYTDSRLTFSANTNGESLLFSAEMHADTLYYNKVRMENVQSQLSSNFRSNKSFKQFGNVDFRARADTIKMSSANLDSLNIDFSLNKDSIRFHQVGSISGKAKFKLGLTSMLADSAIGLKVRNFYVGNKNYAWTEDGTPSVEYTMAKKMLFHHFSFSSDSALFQLNGILSASRQDSVNYLIKNVKLSRISDLLKAKIDFSGTLNGDLTTRALTSKPSIQGGLTVDALKLDDRLVGDADFKSRYNKEKDRFDTKIRVLTDSTKYQKYLKQNDNIGQDITFTGYIKPPKTAVPSDSLYHFDANFKQIDMWVISLLLGNVFLDMEGQASGKGYIGGNLNDFDFHADFQTKNVFAKPNFMKTNYFLNGHVAVDRHKGIVFDNIKVLDTKGGTGVLDGKIDLNNFKPVKYFDLTLVMDHLKFLNNDLSPGVPFYGDVSGTGKVKLSGSNASLFLESEKPIKVSQSSLFALPLLNQTEVSEDHKFIRFVNSFKDPQQAGKGVSADTTQNQNRRTYKNESNQRSIADLSFSERFNLDLQFVANKEITTKLVFDPVTGEVLTADGTGRLRVSLQDQDLKMFGSFSIDKGNYDFVTSEIISRKLSLEPGGTIVWEGSPDNARLDIDAVYHARPYISPLVSGQAIDPQNQDKGQRVPVDLVVEITGTVQTVENNYYFKLPNTLSITSGSTLSYTINEINRSGQQKLLQAISILATGQFLPTQGAGTGAMLGQSLGRSSTVVNPLLSNQVISPLLSDQINALVNSDVTHFDVDFNLNAYNEIDLGLAVRFYNDKLVLRREGQITGESQRDLGDRIGDLSARYRIRPGLSLEIFHRQDQILNILGASSQARDVTPNVDGIGLEAKLEFNSWKAIPGKFKRILGGNTAGTGDRENSQNQEQK